MIREALSREDVIRVIERKGCGKVPICHYKWWGNGLEEALGQPLRDMAEEYPDDIHFIWYDAPGYEQSWVPGRPEYRFGYKDYSVTESHSIGNTKIMLDTWDELDAFLAHVPDLEALYFDRARIQAQSANGRYMMGAFWGLFHDQLWLIRGMENLMMDYYDNPEGLKTLCRCFLEMYKKMVDYYAEIGCDGIFSSDDLGHQSGSMMSPEIFLEIFFPFYREFCEYVHSKGMHVFLHSCGDNSKLMKFLVEAGVDVFHPVQAGCMDYDKTAQEFGNQISFLAGFDVQKLIVNGTPDEVTKGVKDMLDSFWKPEGGLLAAAGNGIMPGTPLANITAAFQAIAEYKRL